jgi:hypothetical protein
MKERRQYIRYDIEGNAILKTRVDAPGSIKADLVNIGFQGMSLSVQEKIAEGSDVTFELTTKLYDKPVIGEGKVVYVKEDTVSNGNIFRLGIEFIHIDKKAIQYILVRIQEDICAEARKKRVA